jgi:uncharacterized protein (TIGR02466 family)
MPASPPGPEILRLWPTQFLRHTLPGADRANPLLAALVLDRDARRAQMTTGYLDDDIFAVDDPAVQWLRQCVGRAVLDYAKTAGVDVELDWHLQGWANVNRFGDYHNLHNHPHSWASGTYYVQVPAPDADATTGRDDLNPGCISFFDPRPQANMNAIRGDGQVDPEFRILPKPGEILLWPAFIHHLVHPNLSRETPRISISFNVVLRWRDSYVPA